MVVTLANDILDIYFLCNCSIYFLYHILVLKNESWIKADHYIICVNQGLFLIQMVFTMNQGLPCLLRLLVT